MKPNTYYSIDGVEVFLALEEEMPKNVQPFKKGHNHHAYKLSDFDTYCQYNDYTVDEANNSVGCTYYESYYERYAENGAPICFATVVNCENEQYTTEDWVLVDELKEINEELVLKGFDFLQNTIPHFKNTNVF